MKEATDVLAATARLLNAVAETLEKAANPALTAADIYPRREPVPAAEPAAPAAAPTARKKRVTAANVAPSVPVPPAPASATVADPLMQMDAPAAPTPAAPAAASAIPSTMTENESSEKAKEIAQKLCAAFPEKEADNRPKGFRLALGLLAKHNAKRTTDLVHAQRVQFITEGEALLATAQVAA